MAALLNVSLFFYFYLYRIEHEEFFFSSLSFCQHRTRPARDQSYKAAYCRKTDVTQRERSNSISFFPLFILRYYKPDRKKERKENHISRLHMGLLAEWILYIVAASFLSPPKVLSAGLTIRCNGVRWSKPIALLLTQSDPAAFFFSPRRLLFCSRHRQ